MNKHSNGSDRQPPLAADLEARIVALTLGEASDFEREQLQQLIAEHPEASQFQTEIQRVHALMTQLGQQPENTDLDSWKLSDPRRAELLSRIGDGRSLEPKQITSDQNISNQESAPEPSLARVDTNRPSVHLLDQGDEPSQKPSLLNGWVKLAIAVCLVGIVVGLLLPGVHSDREVARNQSDAHDLPTIWNYDEAPAAMSLPENESRQEELFNQPAAGNAGELSRAPFQHGPEPAARQIVVDGVTPSVSAPPTNREDLPKVYRLQEEIQYFPVDGDRGGAKSQDEFAGGFWFGGGGGFGGGGDFKNDGARATLAPKSTAEPITDFESSSIFGRTPRIIIEPEEATRQSDVVGDGDEVLDATSQEEYGLKTIEEQKAQLLPRRRLGKSSAREPDQLSFGAKPQSVRKSTSQERDVKLNSGVRKRRIAGEVLGETVLGETLSLGRDLVLEDRSGHQSPQRPDGRSLNEQDAGRKPFSTFSLHVGDVSFKLARNALASGSWPAASKIRIEEFVNAMDYGDPLPRGDEKVACQIEQAIDPFTQQRNVMRIALRTAAAGRSATTPLRLTFLLDNSGSMERIDRRQAVQHAFTLLCDQLKPADEVTLISFARTPRLLADKIAGNQAQKLVALVEGLPSRGGTNLESALKLAFEKAQEHRAAGSQNRVILLTDGAVNLGDADPENLTKIITAMRHHQIAFDAAGIGADGLNDTVLESLTRQGDGRYYVLASADDADENFVKQIAGALRPTAGNVKVQVQFNPGRVGKYKLLGFDKHRLKKQDFRNDQVDAAELAAAESGVALYRFEAKPDGQGDIGTVSVRFRDRETGKMVENTWPIPYGPAAPTLQQSPASLRLAATAGYFAAILKGDPIASSVDLKTLAQMVAEIQQSALGSDRVNQLASMIAQARIQTEN